MRALVAALVVLFAGCASYSALQTRQSTAADVQAAMGKPVDELSAPDGERWLYYPSQPFGRKVFVARLGADGKLIALEQRLAEEYVAKLIPNQSRKEDVRALFGPPFQSSTFPRLNREIWSWHMYKVGNLPYGLHVQMSPDGVVREVYMLDESRNGDRDKDPR